jgi:hypothetical protein
MTHVFESADKSGNILVVSLIDPGKFCISIFKHNSKSGKWGGDLLADFMLSSKDIAEFKRSVYETGG